MIRIDNEEINVSNLTLWIIRTVSANFLITPIFPTSPTRITSRNKTTFRIIYSAIKMREGDRRRLEPYHVCTGTCLDWNFQLRNLHADLHVCFNEQRTLVGLCSCNNGVLVWLLRQILKQEQIQLHPVHLQLRGNECESGVSQFYSSFQGFKSLQKIVIGNYIFVYVLFFNFHLFHFIFYQEREKRIKFKKYLREARLNK